MFFSLQEDKLNYIVLRCDFFGATDLTSSFNPFILTLNKGGLFTAAPQTTLNYICVSVVCLIVLWFTKNNFNLGRISPWGISTNLFLFFNLVLFHNQRYSIPAFYFVGEHWNALTSTLKFFRRYSNLNEYIWPKFTAKKTQPCLTMKVFLLKLQDKLYY